PFAIPARVRLGEGNLLALATPAPRPFALGTDWTPVGGSADGAVGGELVFVGYGISAPDLGWDEYAGLEVRGRIVLALGGEPRRGDDLQHRGRTAGDGSVPRARGGRGRRPLRRPRAHRPGLPRRTPDRAAPRRRRQRLGHGRRARAGAGLRRRGGHAAHARLRALLGRGDGDARLRRL